MDRSGVVALYGSQGGDREEEKEELSLPVEAGGRLEEEEEGLRSRRAFCLAPCPQPSAAASEKE